MTNSPKNVVEEAPGLFLGTTMMNLINCANILEMYTT